MCDWLVHEGLSTNAITYRLRTLSVPTEYNCHWSQSSVVGMLKNQAHTGKTYAFTFRQGTNKRKPEDGWIDIPDAASAIISRELFRVAQNQLRLNDEKPKRNARQECLLRGHL